MNKAKYTLAAIYDTETTNMYSGKESRAFPCLFIVNDIRGIDLKDYVPDRDDSVKYMRYETEMQEYVDSLVEWGRDVDRTPVIAAYNLMFDLKPLMFELRRKYMMRVCAQSSTHVYTLDLIDDDGNHILRFWDTYYLELRGLSAMGVTCGLDKAVGDWDYTKIRTPETYLTKEELHYAKRDVQVIPAYLKYLMQSHEWLKQTDFGNTVLTKTSLVRQMAKKKIGNVRILKDNGKYITQTMLFSKLCMQELPKSFFSYGLRKACFRGGLTFTAARYAMTVQRNVVSMDVTSMHHAFINGRYIPVKFKRAKPEQLETAYDYTVNQTRVQDVLYDYYRPFQYAFHMLIRFNNIRLRKGTCFDEWGIGIIPSAKFRKRASRYSDDTINNYANIHADEMNRIAGWIDSAYGATFAFGKLYSADCAFIHLTEVELFAISLVYEWDSHECVLGEMTQHFDRPPDYVTLQSNMLFGMKEDVKEILRHYERGVRYELPIPETLPPDLALQIRNGAVSRDFLEGYYNSTVKGMFNGIYGTQAQDVYKPDFLVDIDGTIAVDSSTQITEFTWNAMQPENCKVLYTYGMRIVGGSRLHLVLAMKLLYDSLGSRVSVLGGDTDSLKVRCDSSVTNDDLLGALEPLHKAVTNAIDMTQERVRCEYPEMASTLDGVGTFEVERSGNHDRYAYHMEAWNKARVSVDFDGNAHLTCAGLSRPDGAYTMEDYIEDAIARYGAETALPLCLGYNTWVTSKLSFSLESHIPTTTDVFDDWVTDYRGIRRHVVSHESNALYPSGRLLGDMTKTVNNSSIWYVSNEYSRAIDTREKILSLDDSGNPVMYIDGNMDSIG